jgi:choice-of-anchor B domain-containing protein
VANFENETPQLLGSLTSYTERGYNHSGWLSDDGKYYYMADENHGFRMKTLDVSNLNDIQEVGLFNLPGGTVNQIPHNQFIHCGRLYVSYYYDGLVVYDLADPAHPNPIFHYDTYPQVNDNSYEGAWGVYPSLPSGNVLISDMQTGLYIIGGTVKEE